MLGGVFGSRFVMKGLGFLMPSKPLLFVVLMVMFGVLLASETRRFDD